MTYTLIFKREGKKDLVRHGLDKINAVIIPAELKMAYPKSFAEGKYSVEVYEEN